MTPPQIEVPHDPLLAPILHRLGPARTLVAGVAWSAFVEVAAYVVLLGFGMSAGYLHHDPNARGAVFAYQILVDVGGPPIIWALYAWLRLASGRLMDEQTRQTVFLEESPGAGAALPRDAPRRWLRHAWLIGLAVAGAGVIAHLMHPPGWNAARALHAQLRLAASIPLWYALWMSVATAAATAMSLRAAFARYPIQIHVFHPDAHGGFGPLRRFIGTLVTFLLAISALLAAAVALATITAQISGDRLDPVLGVYVIGFLLIAPAMLVAFIWPAHNAMVRARTRFTDAAGSLIAQASPPGGRSLTHADLDKMRTAREVSEILDAFPVWPFNPGRLRRAIAGILSPLLVGVVLEIVLRRLR
jgi:hypothetical protein